MTPAMAQYSDAHLKEFTPLMRLLAANRCVDELERVLRSRDYQGLRDYNEMAKREQFHHPIECTGGVSDLTLARELRGVQDRLRSLVKTGPEPMAPPKPRRSPRRVTRKRAIKPEKKLYTSGEAAEYLGLSRNQVYSLESSDKIRRLPHMGRKVLFSQTELDRFVQKGGRS
jgi:excisionase family DNA binding protein